jgi:hypothetical protein
MSKPELLSIRNFGEKSYNELYGRLRDMDLLPPDLDPEAQQPDPEQDEQEGTDGEDTAPEAEPTDVEVQG